MNIDSLFNSTTCPICNIILNKGDGYGSNYVKCSEHIAMNQDYPMRYRYCKIVFNNNSIIIDVEPGRTTVWFNSSMPISTSILSKANDIHHLFDIMDKYKVLL